MTPIEKFTEVFGIMPVRPSPTLAETDVSNRGKYDWQLVLEKPEGYRIENDVAWSGRYQEIQYVDKTAK